MIEDFRKSISAILYQRVTSPFWGTFVFSWIAWNWRLVYLTIFIKSDKLKINKLEYIEENLSIDFYNLGFIPIIISVVVLTLVPLISNGAYWLSLIYRNWKVKQKIKLENKVPLTIEESIQLRSELLTQEDKFKKLTSEKDHLISTLTQEVEELRNKCQKLIDENDDIKRRNKEYDKQNKVRIRKKDLTKVFVGDWLYKSPNGTDKLFYIHSENRLQYRGDNNDRYDVYQIRRYDNNQFELLIYPWNLWSRTEFELKIININRTNDGSKYEGNEIAVVKSESALNTTLSKIEIISK